MRYFILVFIFLLLNRHGFSQDSLSFRKLRPKVLHASSIESRTKIGVTEFYSDAKNQVEMKLVYFKLTCQYAKDMKFDKKLYAKKIILSEDSSAITIKGKEINYDYKNGIVEIKGRVLIKKDGKRLKRSKIIFVNMRKRTFYLKNGNKEDLEFYL